MGLLVVQVHKEAKRRHKETGHNREVGAWVSPCTSLGSEAIDREVLDSP